MNEWKNELERLFAATERARGPRPGRPPLVRKFLADTVVPAFEELAEVLRDHGRDVEVVDDDRTASILVSKDGDEEFYYEIVVKAYGAAAFAFPAIPLHDPAGKTYRAEARIREGPLRRDMTHASRSDVVEAFLREYRRHIMWHQ